MIDRNDYDKALLKCLEALISMTTRVAVWASDDRVSEQEAEEFNNVYYMWISAYHDLKQAMNGDEL
jgi:hypothetical protein